MRIRNRHARFVVISVVLVGTLVPEEGQAQDAEPQEVEPRAALAPGFDPALLTAPSAMLAPKDRTSTEAESEPEPEAQRFELAFGLSPFGALGLGGLGIGGGIGGLQAGAPMALDLGIPLGSRALLVVALTGVYGESGGTATFLSVSVPVGVLVYLDRPRAGAFIPTVRVTGSGGYATSFGSEALSLGLGVRAGLTWLPIENLGMRCELGAGATTAFTGGTTVVSVNLQGGISLVVRI